MEPIPCIRPISDLRTKLNDVCAQAAQLQEPIFLTKNGAPAVVLLDAKAYEEEQQRARFSMALREAEIEEKYRPEAMSATDVRAHLDEIFASMEHAR